ncbi:MAG: hypothetical protein ACOC85_01050 [Thermoplasmatota archaeon]
MYHLLDEEGKEIYLIGIVKGLVSESNKLNNYIEDIDFEIGALPISEGELNGLIELHKKDIELDIEPSKPEQAYAKNLERFGEVKLPPPSYMELLRYCEEHDIDIKAIDMDEGHYTMAYCEHVNGKDWILQAFREKRVNNVKFTSDGPEKFALEWDEWINKLKGYKALEDHRERIMVKNLTRFSKRGVILSIIEYERMEGVVVNFKSKGWQIS